MAINRESSNDVSFKLFIKRDGKFITNSDGAKDLQDFVMGCTVMESIDSAAIEAEIIMQDSAGLINSLTGSETWVLVFETGNNEGSYSLVAYNIDSRARNGNSEAYIVQCVSPEFMKNETTSIFGSSNTLFGKKTNSKEIVEKLIKKDIGTSKNVFVEDSKNKHTFVATNWRVFDAIYWIAQKSVRAGQGKTPQNGFLFWENRGGFFFKSIDKIISDVNTQKYEDKTNLQNNKVRLYKYSYSPKKAGDEGNDDLRIDSISFPEDRNYLSALRNGSYAGWSSAFDPSVFANSKLGSDTFDALRYQLGGDDGLWKSMSHLGAGVINPIEVFDDEIKELVNFPKRIRYGILPNRIYDQQKDDKRDKQQYNELPYLQAYQHLRVQSFKAIQLLVNVPGNLDLYVGYGVEIDIPVTKPKGDRYVQDRKYSGRYVISGLRHKYDGKSLSTEMLLYKDSIPKR